jgi:hypothetical protein
MMKMTVACGLLAMAGIVSASAEEFPLTFRTIPAKDVLAFPGGMGASMQLRPERPESLRREPRALSQHPLYGTTHEASTGASYLVRLDESKGDGRGYDQLIVDINQNGDLTDDPVLQPLAGVSQRRSGVIEPLLFGPIQAPADKALVGGRPTYYARAYTYNLQLLSSGRTLPNITYGQVMLKAAWYLESTVTLNGSKQKVGLYDGDANQHLGDLARLQVVTSRNDTLCYFRGGDSWLVETDASGSPEAGMAESEAYGFGPLLYLGGKPYKLALAPDCRSLRVDPWPEALADVALQPNGDQVRSLRLAWEQPGGRWQLLQPAVSSGKVKVPSGNYRLYTCEIAGKETGRDAIRLSATQRSPEPSVSVAAGGANTFNCGAPLNVIVSAVKTRAASASLLEGFSGGTAANAASSLRISAVVTGAAGETYSSFQMGDRPNAKPPKPTFTITDAAGKVVANGNLEYG